MGITTLHRSLIALLLFITVGYANAQSPNYQLPYYVRANWFSIRWTVPVVSYDSVYVKGINGWMATAPRTVWGNLPGKPTFSTVATSGSYNDLTNQPSIPTNNNQLANGAGYLTSFTEIDPTVSAYAKSLSSFAVIKSSTDVLYKPIGYTPTKADVGLSNVLNVDQTNPANIVQSASYRFVTDAEKSSWGGKQDNIAAGTTSQYYRGDKTWQTISKADVGLSNVDNTSDANKPVSTATLSALNGKQNTLTLTTTGSGAATLTAGVLNIPTSIRVYVSAVAVGQSRSQLNTSYPTANVGDMVLAPSITLGGAIYLKSSTTGGGTWQIISAPPVL